MSNTTPTPSTPKVPKPKQPADPAGQTTTIPAIDADSTPWVDDLDDDLDDNITPTPKKKRKLPRWGWSVVGGIIAAILYWVARDLLLFAVVVATGAVMGPVVNSAIREWQEERERMAALATDEAGQPTTATTQFATKKFSSGWHFGMRMTFAVLFGALGGLIGWIVVWGLVALVLRFSEFWIPGWAPYALGAIAAALMAIIFGAFGNKLATKLL